MKSSKCAVWLVPILSASAIPLAAQEQLALEEVIVTAQIRAESLQDVPASVSAVSGDKLLTAGISKIEDLQSYVPNLSMSETGIGTNIYIRGIGSGINQGFEQSVAMFVDGIYYGRAQLSRAPFLDLERVEVLRGPQNILYGKNSIAGAMSVVTQKPTDEFFGSISLTYEPEDGENIADLILSGPLSDSLRGRLAYRYRTLDGYIENIDGGDEPDRDEDTIRLSLAWDINDNLDANFKVEQGSFDVEGRQIEIVNESPSLNPALGGATWSQFLASFNAPPSVLNTTLDGRRSSNGDFSKNDTFNTTATFNYHRENYTITSITGWLQYDYDELCDCDFTSADLFTVASREDYSQFSQEFRITSPVGQTFEWMAGVYYQTSELEFNDTFAVSTTANLLPLLDTVLSSPAAFGANYPANAASTQLSGFSVPRDFDQDSDVYSAFLQFTWNVNDRFRATFGGRYSYEEKSASRILDFADVNGDTPAFDAGFVPANSIGIDYLVGSVFLAARHNLEGNIDEASFAPSITLEWDINDNLLSYLNWSRGFKTGGFDVRSNNQGNDTVFNNPFQNVVVPAGAFDYDEERADNIELGFKTAIGPTAELNVAYFYTKYEDLQVSIYDGVLSFNVGNAAEAVTQGIEIDGRWLLTEGLTLSGSLAWLDFEFDDYPNGQCTQLERITLAAVSDDVCFADFEGRSNQYVSDFSGALSLNYIIDVGSSWTMSTTLDVVFTTDYNPSQNLDPDIEQDGYSKINARIAFRDYAEKWELALIAKNLTSEDVISYANDSPLAANLAQATGYYAIVEPRRTVAFQASYRF